jgi:hypothetical protein
MFNWFKKNKRSSWMDGLIAAEEMTTLYGHSGATSFFWKTLSGRSLCRNQGFLYYLQYYRNNLK